MRRLAVGLGLFIALATCSPAAWAGVELILIERPFHARHLAGVVLDQTGAPISGVLVEVCEPFLAQVRTQTSMEMEQGDCATHPEHALGSTKTDTNGHFAFNQLGLSRTRYLHLRFDGFNPMQLSVKWGLFAHREFRVVMHVAT
jgi:hypothetical protein